MRMNKINWQVWIIPLVNLLVIGLLMPLMPSQIPTHFDLYFTADQYGARTAILMHPILLLGINVLLQALPLIDPLRKNYERFRSSQAVIRHALNFFFIGFELIHLSVIFEVSWISPAVVLQVLFGLLFMILGNIFPKIKHNYMIGIKVSWALNDEENWTMTHRFGGKVWFAGGLLMAAAVVLPQNVRMGFMIALMLVIAFLPMVYSYGYFRKHQVRKVRN